MSLGRSLPICEPVSSSDVWVRQPCPVAIKDTGEGQVQPRGIWATLGLDPRSVLLYRDSMVNACHQIRQLQCPGKSQDRNYSFPGIRSQPLAPAAHMLQGFWLRLPAGAEGRRVGEVMGKAVDFPPVSGSPTPTPRPPPPRTPVPPLLPQPAHWALEIQALCLRLQTSYGSPSEAEQGKGHPRPDCLAAPDPLKSLEGLH